MSPTLATTFAIALYIIALLPVAAAAFLPGGRRIMAVYLAILLAIAGYHTGVFSRGSLAPTDMLVRSATSADETQCKKILELMRESGLEVDRSDPAAPKIIGTGADQIPVEVRDVLLACTAAPAINAEPAAPAAPAQ